MQIESIAIDSDRRGDPSTRAVTIPFIPRTTFERYEDGSFLPGYECITDGQRHVDGIGGKGWIGAGRGQFSWLALSLSSLSGGNHCQ